VKPLTGAGRLEAQSMADMRMTGTRPSKKCGHLKAIERSGMSDDVVDPGKRYHCEETSTAARVFLKRGSPWPIQAGMKVLYKKSESASAHWMGGLVLEVRDGDVFVLEPI
jgi:hypothetical protein